METPMSVCAAVLAHVEQAFRSCSLDPGQTLVAVGALVVDSCCDGGILAVAPLRSYRTLPGQFPTEATTDGKCFDGPIAVDLMVSRRSCFPVILDNGQAPSIADQEAAAADVLADAAIVWGAIVDDSFLGADASGEPIWERALVSQTYIDPMGGCSGSDTLVTIGLDAGRWCPPCVAPET